MKLPINPETRVSALLEAYPEAEQILVDLAPPFAALRNPLLRRTVARVATLEQAAKVGGITVSDLVLSLREALGADGGPVGEVDVGEDNVVPAWVDSSRPVAVIDADELLAAGSTPLTETNRALAGMNPGQRLLVTAAFEPAPLVDALRTRGHEVYTGRGDNDQWLIHVRRG